MTQVRRGGRNVMVRDEPTGVTWEMIGTERDPARKVELMLEAGLLVREDGELKPTEPALAFIQAMDERTRRLVPIFDHIAGRAECYHRPMGLGNPPISVAEVEETLREADKLLQRAQRGRAREAQADAVEGIGEFFMELSRQARVRGR